MSRQRKDLTGERYGNWVVIGLSNEKSKDGKPYGYVNVNVITKPLSYIRATT